VLFTLLTGAGASLRGSMIVEIESFISIEVFYILARTAAIRG
jgi:hypothetical protein